MAQSLFLKTPSQLLEGNGFPPSQAYFKYGTENTYVCTWDTWGPFAANLEGGARWDPPMGLLYTSWVGMVGVSDPPTLSEGQKSGWKCPDHEVSLATAKYYV